MNKELISDDEATMLMENRSGETVTQEQIEYRIANVGFFVLPETTVTICSITLDNGFSVRGESACVDPANFSEQLGEKYAYENAFHHLWQLFGFLLAEKRYCRGE